MMGADGVRIGDGSWELTVEVTDLQVEKTLRVTGDLHIGGVMLRLTEALDIAMNWSDHGLWWPLRNMWLSRTRSTLDQYGVQADARLWFTPMHKTLRLQMPDLQLLDMRVDFSTSVFNAVIKLCKDLGLRHPEELSLARKLTREDLKKNKGVSATRRETPHGLRNHSNHHLSNNSLDSPGGGGGYRSNPGTPQVWSSPGSNYNGTLARTPGNPYPTLGSSSGSPYMSYNANGTLSPGSMHSLAFEGGQESTLSNSPQVGIRDALLMLYKPKNFAEKARINAGWLDSSRSLMEQGVRETDIVLFRYKFFSFYDLNPKYDMVRINQIYEQAKWSIMSEEIDCTEEEMMMFAALQLQVQLQSTLPQPDLDATNGGEEDEIDAALTELQVSLDGSHLSSPGDITHIPELQDELRFFKPKKLTLKSYKRHYFMFKDTQLRMWRCREDETSEPPLLKVNLRGCEVVPDVHITSQKYNIKLFMPSSGGLQEVWIRADTEEQYAKWMAAFRLASKGKTMADSSYEQEVQSILAFLSMQHPAPAQVLPSDQLNFQPDDFVASRFLKKLKTKQLAQRVLEAHANVRDMILLEAKMNYIKAWQALPEYGITYFIVKMKGSKKEELMGVASNRLIRQDLSSGDSIKTWRFQNMKTWKVNWEIKQLEVEFEEERVAFQSLTADCKIVHEFIGGYIFLSMRSGDKNQALDQEMFHKLTGGWIM